VENELEVSWLSIQINSNMTDNTKAAKKKKKKKDKKKDKTKVNTLSFGDEEEEPEFKTKKKKKDPVAELEQARMRSRMKKKTREKRTGSSKKRGGISSSKPQSVGNNQYSSMMASSSGVYTQEYLHSLKKNATYMGGQLSCVCVNISCLSCKRERSHPGGTTPCLWCVVFVSVQALQTIRHPQVSESSSFSLSQVHSIKLFMCDTRRAHQRGNPTIRHTSA
jgi:hypothetical protein